MRAVILAGGEGSRLAPMALGSCKPMTSLVERPVLHHIIDLLQRHQITQICITLCHNPQAVMEYFGDGSQLGVSITYFIEEHPLGTAGGVKRCMERLEGEDFLVIGGDCICDLDISRAIQFHREKGGVATLVLYPHQTPLEYGLVHLDIHGRITHFLEKPTWGQVMTNLVNTGIYILTTAAMDRVPEGEGYDFGKDLFPTLLREGAPLYGAVLKGYWRDMGDCDSYLKSCYDVLHGKVKLALTAPQREMGIWSESQLPADVTLVPPCYIGANVVIHPHCLLGPHVVIEQGCEIQSHAIIQRSTLLRDCHIGADATLYGAVVCQEGRIGRGCILHQGAVVGKQAQVGHGATLMEGVRLWPGLLAPAGERICHSIVGEQGAGTLAFGDGGVLRGAFGGQIDSQTMLILGGILADRGEILLGCGGGDGAKIYAQSFASGVAGAGGVVRLHSLSTPAQSSWLAQRRGASIALFVEQDGERCYLHLTGQDGLPLERGDQRNIEGRLRLGQRLRATGAAMGRMISLPMVEREYSRDIAARAPLYPHLLHPVTLAVEGSPALGEALRIMGCTVLTGWRQGVPLFVVSHGGQRVEARDEEGAEVDSGQMLALIALIEMEHGGGVLAVPPSATVAVELVAAGFQGQVLRLGRDGRPAVEQYIAQPWVRDGAFAAARIASRMAITGETLRAMLKKIPRLTSQRREVPLAGGRGEVMRVLAQECEQPYDGGEGIRIRRGGGWVYLAPLSRRAALQVVAEGLDMEASAQLCDSYADHIKKLDRHCYEQDSQEEPEK